MIVDRACLAVLPPEVPIESAALAEPIAVVVRAANNVGLTGATESDGPVLVIGAGSIGLAMTAVLRHRGYEVDVMARHDAQRAAAERLGAGFTPIAEYSVVVDAAGTHAAIDEAVARLAPGATLAVVSTWWDPVQFGFGLLSKEATVVPATIYGMRNGRREFDDAVDVLAANPVIADVLVTHRFGLDDAPEAFATAGNRAAGAIKVIIQP